MTGGSPCSAPVGSLPGMVVSRPLWNTSAQARPNAAGTSRSIAEIPDRSCARTRATRLVNLPALRLKVAETLSHTALSTAHAVQPPRRRDRVQQRQRFRSWRPLKVRGIPVAVHVDGLEAERAKWEGFGATYYAWAERSAVTTPMRSSPTLSVIGDYVRERYGRPSEYLPYGAPDRQRPRSAAGRTGIVRRRLPLTVARFEPENHVLRSCAATEPVRGTPADRGRRRQLLPRLCPGGRTRGGGDERIQLLGSVWDQELLDQLYLRCPQRSAHGHSVGARTRRCSGPWEPARR